MLAVPSSAASAIAAARTPKPSSAARVTPAVRATTARTAGLAAGEASRSASAAPGAMPWRVSTATSGAAATAGRDRPEPARGPRRWLSAARGALLGGPAPLCPCGPLPTYRAHLEQGAGAAALAALVAAPALGLDALLVTGAILGGGFTAVRAAAAVGVAIVFGIVFGAVRAPAPFPRAQSQPPRDLGARVRLGVHTAIEEVVDHVVPWLIVGITLAAVLEPLASRTPRARP